MIHEGQEINFMEISPTSDKSYAACLLVIGDEILSGRTQDLNVQFLGETLGRHGIALKEVRILPDDENILIPQLKEVKLQYDYVFTTGGIGPTHDDITADCVARALGLPLIEDGEALKRLKSHYKENLTDERAKMAKIPFGSHLIDNPVTSAPGFYIDNVYVLAGVPRIMRAMIMSLLPTLKGGIAIASKSVSCLLGEGIIAKDLKDLQEQYTSVSIGSYPFFRPDGHGTTLVVRGKNEKMIERVLRHIKQIILDHGGISEEDVNLLFTHSAMRNDHSSSPIFPITEQRKYMSFLPMHETKNLIMGGILIAALCVIIMGVLGWIVTPSFEIIKKTISPMEMN